MKLPVILTFLAGITNVVVAEDVEAIVIPVVVVDQPLNVYPDFAVALIVTVVPYLYEPLFSNVPPALGLDVSVKV